MRQIKTLFAPAYGALMLSALILTGCAGLTDTGTADLNRAVKLVGPDATLLSRAQSTLDSVPGIDITPEDSFADLTLILRPGGSASKGLFNTRPAIVGVLRQQQEPTYVRLSYTLVDQEGETVAKGEVVGVGQDRTGYFPSLDPQEDDETLAQALDDSLRQLKAEAGKDVRSAPFTGKVSTQIAASNQVAIPVYARAGLSPQHTFKVDGMPETTLRFVGLTQGLAGSETHALLEVVEGQMPELGAKVILE